MNDKYFVLELPQGTSIGMEIRNDKNGRAMGVPLQASSLGEMPIDSLQIENGVARMPKGAMIGNYSGEFGATLLNCVQPGVQPGVQRLQTQNPALDPSRT